MTMGKTLPVQEPVKNGKSAAHYWGLVPISTTMILGLVCGPESGAENVLTPALFRAKVSAFTAGAKACISATGTNTVMPSLGATGTPAGGSPTASPHGAARIQSASRSVLSKTVQKGRASGALPATIPANCWPANCFSLATIADCCCADSVRGAACLSSAICSTYMPTIIIRIKTTASDFSKTRRVEGMNSTAISPTNPAITRSVPKDFRAPAFGKRFAKASMADGELCQAAGAAAARRLKLQDRQSEGLLSSCR